MADLDSRLTGGRAKAKSNMYGSICDCSNPHNIKNVVQSRKREAHAVALALAVAIGLATGLAHRSVAFDDYYASMDSCCSKLEQQIITSQRDQFAATAEEAFGMFDEDGSGAVDHNELGRVLVQLGVPADQVATMGRRSSRLDVPMDVDGDGGIDHEEFTKWFVAGACDTLGLCICCYPLPHYAMRGCAGRQPGYFSNSGISDCTKTDTMSPMCSSSGVIDTRREEMKAAGFLHENFDSELAKCERTSHLSGYLACSDNIMWQSRNPQSSQWPGPMPSAAATQMKGALDSGGRWCYAATGGLNDEAYPWGWLGTIVVVTILAFVLWLAIPLTTFASSILGIAVNPEYLNILADQEMGPVNLSKVTANSPKTSHDIFISYRSDDMDQVYNSLLRNLSDTGLNVFNFEA